MGVDLGGDGGHGRIAAKFQEPLCFRPAIQIESDPRGGYCGPRSAEKDFVLLTAVNRGNSPTTINTLQLHEMPTWLSRLRRRPTRCFVIPNPQLKGYPPNIPFELGPFKGWNGVLRKRQDYVPDLYTGTFYTALYTTHRDKPYLARIPKLKPKPETKTL